MNARNYSKEKKKESILICFEQFLKTTFRNMNYRGNYALAKYNKSFNHQQLLSY